MIAYISQIGTTYEARYERQIPHAVEEVWAMLTENEKLSQWFPELSVTDLRKGGTIQFDMGDGSTEDFTILAYEPLTILAFTWDHDAVRFDLEEDGSETRLVFTETIHAFTDHTPRDLAGWHVCLEVIEALLNGTKLDSRKDRWNELFPLYETEVAKFRE
ncbi:SRPBCC family protein [Aureibacillus halotolerans]|uniref:Uncharacterized protein YndB with AHSA1/START domain n=1 Tax=Aureibacillus halotolerans TaxID=1508390 RepID=A0A4R6UDK1_9BACI|nr:SRPBCC family protein [Aureibacillus halotolerans]TDQ41174.1 uncharacterized protein YndB with AHSA1/START domain [Aureibacillus halotolerans]